jgi:hypothetical protein
LRDDDADLLLAAGGVALVGLALWRGPELVATVRDVVTRGDRLTHAGVAADGVVHVAPEQLRAAAAAVMGRVGELDLLLDVYGCARMVRSEGAAQAAIRTHVALNDQAELGWSSLNQLFTYSTNPGARGFYGQQRTAAALAPGGVTSVRRYATTTDPYVADVWAVEEAMIMHRQGMDPTGGAVKFVDISSMGVQPGTGSYAALVERWAADGLRPFTLPGESPDLVVFRRVGRG